MPMCLDCKNPAVDLHNSESAITEESDDSDTDHLNLKWLIMYAEDVYMVNSKTKTQ